MEPMKMWKIVYTWSDGRVEETKKKFADSAVAGRIAADKIKYSAMAAAALSEIEEEPLYIKEFEVVEA